ncbi:helix-turn-helix domain-containing protein [Amycolatopsis rhabdoformis]|uniref:Helix-turn-helix domain-containing protein n=1 Tax=Amycolatopsis rhabdoformis TaxID=1448059 RepID=A0ABZ1I079_9PSEU|nr:helix-turn-helix domain-containing protein [Amycolatopsis rhabdoformis]WSE27197.1 helix-turn-helix domain-containing protein [Amycolatopsis rhabdoformis]
MKRRDFGQYCGLGRALELVGERWALLIIRDLAIHPRRYTDLLEGLPGIPSNVLATRLKELEQSGIAERQIAPAPSRGVVYVLTPLGRELEPAIHALGRWGATQLGEPRPGEIVTAEALTTSLRAAFDPDRATGLNASWEIHAPDFVVHAVVTEGKLDAGIGPAPEKPGVVITFRPENLPSYVELVQAIKCGLVTIKGPRKLLDTFTRVFTSRGPA